MKQVKLLFLLLTVLPFTASSQSSSIDDLLDYINTEFGRYNKYDSYFDIEDQKLVFANKFGVARIPFRKIDFKINEESSSIDVYCINGEKCIYKYDDDGVRTDWDYYNVSLTTENGDMASSAYIILKKCKELKSLVLYGKINNDTDDSKSLLNYINSQFRRYNKYGSSFNVNEYSKALVFNNDFGKATVPFSQIGFRLNEKHSSIDFYCLDGSKCIQKYDNSGAMTEWDYYNVSLVNDNGGMASEIHTVLSKCKQLQKLYSSNVNPDNNKIVTNESTSDLLDYINKQFSRYNKYGSSFSVNKNSEALVFNNNFGKATVPFNQIDFRLNEKHSSIDFYCLNGSKCIQKYDNSGSMTEWDYYNVSLVNNNGDMASEIYTVLSKCKQLKQLYSSNNNITKDEDIIVTSESVNDLLKYINREFDKYNKYESRFSVDGQSLVFMNKFGRSVISFNSIGFRMNSEHNSIDVYCLDGSKCIQKYDDDGGTTNWDYYNVSLPDGEGMAASANTVLKKCKALKIKVLN